MPMLETASDHTKCFRREIGGCGISAFLAVLEFAWIGARAVHPGRATVHPGRATVANDQPTDDKFATVRVVQIRCMSAEGAMRRRLDTRIAAGGADGLGEFPHPRAVIFTGLGVDQVDAVGPAGEMQLALTGDSAFGPDAAVVVYPGDFGFWLAVGFASTWPSARFLAEPVAL